MRLEARKYLYDVQEAAEFVFQFTAGKDFADYQQNPMLRLAIERAFTATSRTGKPGSLACPNRLVGGERNQLGAHFVGHVPLVETA